MKKENLEDSLKKLEDLEDSIPDWKGSAAVREVRQPIVDKISELYVLITEYKHSKIK